MTPEQSLRTFSLRPERHDLTAVRRILTDETAREARRQGAGNTEMMKLCCIQLFGAGLLQDVLLIWNAKTASMDADASIDVQLLCGAGLTETKVYLEAAVEEEAKAALSRILRCELASDFSDFSVAKIMSGYQDYYSED
jgi:hypothetical protein